MTWSRFGEPGDKSSEELEFLNHIWNGISVFESLWRNGTSGKRDLGASSLRARKIAVVGLGGV